MDDFFVDEAGPVYDLEERLLEFSARAIRLTERFHRSQAGLHLAGQLLRSATSPLASHGEAQAAESAKDFIHKLRLALKELRETLRWLKLARRVPLIENLEPVQALEKETDELIRIFVASIRTTRRNSLQKRGVER